MKAVILAGGKGTRFSEETDFRPKPMIEIGGKPILWHIMKIYSAHGINEFIICCGYRGYQIKEYFSNYFMHTSDVTFTIQNGHMETHRSCAEPWKVTLLDTGDQTMTGGRLAYVEPYVRSDDAFCFTYGDGVSDINISKTIEFHRTHGRLATLTAAYPPGRFGAIESVNGIVRAFKEKPEGDGGFINAGFFVLSPKIFTYIKNSETVWEQEPLASLAKAGQLMAYEHYGFWQPMDTLREKKILEELWSSGMAPWRIWGE